MAERESMSLSSGPAGVDAVISNAFEGVRGTKYTFLQQGERGDGRRLYLYKHADGISYVMWCPDAKTEQKIVDLLAENKTEDARKLVCRRVTQLQYEDKNP